jgi:hypothetical protein
MSPPKCPSLNNSNTNIIILGIYIAPTQPYLAALGAEEEGFTLIVNYSVRSRTATSRSEKLCQKQAKTSRHCH